MRPPSGNRVIKQELKRAEVPNPMAQTAQDQFNSSQSSFYSASEIGQEQQEKLKRLTKPFAVGNQTKRSKAEIREQEIDDMLSEISTPEIDFSERKKIMEALEQRD